MNTYIEIKNGQPKNHPAFEDNLILAFGSVPECWEPVVVVEAPVLSEYQVFSDPQIVYEKVNGVWVNIFQVRDMTDDEKAVVNQAKISLYKRTREESPQKENFTAWVFNEETIKYEPPIPRPEPDQTKLDLGIKTFWCGAENNWKDAPPRPEGQYFFDFFAWQWVAL